MRSCAGSRWSSYAVLTAGRGASHAHHESLRNAFNSSGRSQNASHDLSGHCVTVPTLGALNRRSRLISSSVRRLTEDFGHIARITRLRRPPTRVPHRSGFCGVSDGGRQIGPEVDPSRRAAGLPVSAGADGRGAHREGGRDRVHRAGALSELGRSLLLLLTGHLPFRFALGAIPVQLDLLAPNGVLEMDSARPAAMKAVAWPPNGNRRIGHGGNRARRAYHGYGSGIC
jgi:hypothetical protein